MVRFGEFSFDINSLALRRAGQPVPLRPKAAALLKVLALQPKQVISKQALAEEVWRGRLVSEQSLFQTISELRAALGGAHFIVTYPNQGYCFSPPPVRRPASIWRMAASALMALGVGAMVGDQPETHERGHQPAEPIYVAPAVRAMAAGIERLESGQLDRAAAHFEFALSEDADLAAARALLAETRLAQGRVAEAERLARTLVSGPASDTAAVSAMSVLSRVFEKTGRLDHSIEWARSASEAALSAPMACAALAAGRRLQELLPTDHPDPRPSASPLIAEQPASEDFPVRLVADPAKDCAPWLEPPAGNDLGLCLPPAAFHAVRPTRFA